ncbi:ATP-dependent RNA helicase DbpA [Psychrosphaera aquimarina]|uniref:ATP-dependent RNA helicase DbpA n=1 Tax=Psychrosphaera aquimarina TaxID=2044854 RepID=A0ABU3QWL8_9GAMM|nr:ATP-dependent RNA helicase DbpA [Psychrosphaera aquimarina]MDU0111805.1 ATP-dependent RNA helicase DbpA [Psychrosphaera aquimarina]
MTQTSFSSLALKPDLVSNLATLDYNEMTPIQAQSLPLIIDGKDVIAQGKTGSGKTAAFGLGLLQNLDVKRFRIQSLVLCPTRELADQVAKEIRKLARGIHNIKVLTLCGGVPMGPQIGSLEHGAHIIVGTPGRILDHLDRGRLNLDNLNTLVLDEADKMLEMGFQDAVDAIIDLAPKNRQSLLFSATFPDQIKGIAGKLLKDPIMVKVESTHSGTSIDQQFFNVDNNDARKQAIQLLLMQYQPESCVIFCNTKIETVEVTDFLLDSGFSAIELNGDLEQRDRDQTLVRFANKSISILVATDVASRGLDIDNLDAVINYQLAHDADTHVHRIGRTGRAGSKGVACSLFTNKDSYKVVEIEDYMDIRIKESELPDASVLEKEIFEPQMATLRIDGGKKHKVRPGDILGALTGKDGIAGKDVGKINVLDFCAYVAVHKSVAKDALHKLEKGKLKGRSFRAWRIR